MQDTKKTHQMTMPVFSPLPAEKKSGSVPPPPDRETLRKRLFHTMQHYPLPLIAGVLLFVSLMLWLVGHGDMASWTLLAIVLLGGIPLLWETGQQFLRKEFGVDVIAVLAIIGSLLLQQYLAGALIVLMLSGGEALEAYALRRARSSLSALAERAPRTAHIWNGDELVSIAAEQVDVGMEIVVKPGELITISIPTSTCSAAI